MSWWRRHRLSWPFLGSFRVPGATPPTVPFRDPPVFHDEVRKHDDRSPKAE
jgi:hypothetical protein